jgi:hypothetical protein
MSTKVTVETEGFSVSLPCKMLVRDAVDEGWTHKTITGYIGSGYDFPWRSCDEMYKYAKPIEEPKMIPYDESDVYKLFEDNTIIRSGITGVKTRIQSFEKDRYGVMVYVGSKWVSASKLISEFTQANGHKFQKESN